MDDEERSRLASIRERHERDESFPMRTALSSQAYDDCHDDRGWLLARIAPPPPSGGATAPHSGSDVDTREQRVLKAARAWVAASEQAVNAADVGDDRKEHRWQRQADQHEEELYDAAKALRMSAPASAVEAAPESSEGGGGGAPAAGQHEN